MQQIDDKYENTLPIYENRLPQIDENVLVIFTEYKETHIEAELLEYNSIKGLMTFEDATRKKKVYNWNKEIPLNKTMIAKVDEIFSNNYVKLSTAYFDQRMDPKELRKELMKPFSDNKALITIIKKICRNNNLDFNDFWLKVIYKIMKIKKKEDLNASILDYISENEDVFNNIVKDTYPENYEHIVNEYHKLILNKIYKIQSKFLLITKSSIENTKNLLNLACENNKDFLFTIKYETTPTFILESSSENSTDENHNNFLRFVEDNSDMFNVKYTKVN